MESVIEKDSATKLTERFVKAQKLAAQYVEAKNRIEAIAAEKRQLLRPSTEFKTIEDITNYLNSKDEFEGKYTALDTEQTSLEAFVKEQQMYAESTLYRLLSGDNYELPTDEFRPEISIKLPDCRVYADEGYIFIEPDNKAPQPDYNPYSNDFTVGKAIISNAIELHRREFPDEGRPSPATILKVAQLIATTRLIDAVISCQPGDY